MHITSLADIYSHSCCVDHTYVYMHGEHAAVYVGLAFKLDQITSDTYICTCMHVTLVLTIR